jgi:WD40 repeat protein
VLTTAWSATSEASRTELLLLKELNAEYANDPRFLMVGHVMDEDLEPARKLVGELQIPWIQLIPTPAMRDHLLTSLPDSTLPVSVFGRHGDQSQPTALRGEAIRKAVKETLGPPIQFTAIVNDTSSPEMQDINPRLWSAVYSPDGLTIATTAGWDNPVEPGELVLWDVATGQARAVVRQSDTIRTVAFSPDGSRLAIGDFAGYVSFLDPTNGAVVRVLPQQIKLVNSITFTPNGRTLVSGGFDETVRLWDAETGEARQVFALSGQGVVKVAVSPDGQWLAAGTWPGYVHMWRFAKGEKAYEIDAGSESGDGTRITEAVEFSPDSKHLVTGSWDGTLKLWSVETGKLVREFDRRGRDLKGATFSPDGRRLATSDSHGRVEIWSPESGDQIGRMSAHSDMCFGLAFSPNGLWLATAGWDRALRVWDVETQRLITTFTR